MICRLLQGRKIRHDPVMAVLILLTTEGEVSDLVTVTNKSDSAVGVVIVTFLRPSAAADAIAEFVIQNEPSLKDCSLNMGTGDRPLFRGAGHFEGKVRVGIRSGKFVVLSES